MAPWNQAGLICYNDDDNYLKFAYDWASNMSYRVISVGIETEGRYQPGFVYRSGYPRGARIGEIVA